MKAVGLRELKNRLAEYVRDVRRGEVVLITDRGTVVAEIVPPSQHATQPDVPAGFRELAARGLATLPTRPKSEYRLVKRKFRPGLAQELLDAERDDR